MEFTKTIVRNWILESDNKWKVLDKKTNKAGETIVLVDMVKLGIK